MTTIPATISVAIETDRANLTDLEIAAFEGAGTLEQVRAAASKCQHAVETRAALAGLTIYRIRNTVSGLDVGTYAATSPDAALEALAHEVGYYDHLEAIEDSTSES